LLAPGRRRPAPNTVGERVTQGPQRERIRAPPADRRWFDLALGELWDTRDLLGTLVWRNLTVRYKQSVIGIAWAILKPVMQMLVFSVVFGPLADLPSDGIPYPGLPVMPACGRGPIRHDDHQRHRQPDRRRHHDQQGLLSAHDPTVSYLFTTA
jgi:hypothetical protein